MNDTQQAAEVWTVPGWDEELRCESEHGYCRWDAIAETCSTRVVARKFTECGKSSFFICLNSYAYNIRALADPDCDCEGCERPVADCWTVRPI